MEHIHNNLMKLEGSLGNVPQKMSFYNKFFIFCGTLPGDPPNFIKLYSFK
jgi:hypothetical protein